MGNFTILEPLKMHKNHVVACPKCKNPVLTAMGQRIVSNEKTKWYRCLLCYFQFRCCGVVRGDGAGLTKRIASMQKRINALVLLDQKRRVRNGHIKRVSL